MSGRAILCLTFDNMGNAANVGIREHAAPLADDPGLTVGYPRVLALLDELQLKASFFVEGWNALHHAGLIRDIVARGHEVGLHGWVHEVFHKLDEIDAERVMSDSLAAFRMIGVEPKGFRAPGGRRGENTLALLRKYGIGFDSSVDEQAVATQPVMLDHGIVNVPWLWPLIDYYQYHMHPDGPRSPAQYEALLYAAMERAVEEGGMMTPIFHAFVSGADDEKFGVLKRFLHKAAADRRVTILTASQAANEAKRA